jgi:ketosteroid isomerase-like protein
MPERLPSDLEILAANARFYDSFTRGDYVGMAALWAEHAPVTCLHPMSPVLVGRKAILDSWRDILRTAPPVALRCEGPSVHRVSAEVAIVTCYEGEGSHPAHLAATNIFVLEGGQWRMVHHQAGPLERPMARATERHALN